MKQNRALRVKVIEHLKQQASPTYSFEIVPPVRGLSLQDCEPLLEKLASVDPLWINVTSHSTQPETLRERAEGSSPNQARHERPSMFEVCELIQQRFKIDAVPHLLRSGFSEAETEQALLRLRDLGVETVFALRGDSTGSPISPNEGGFARDLVQHIRLFERTRLSEQTRLPEQFRASETIRSREKNQGVVRESRETFCIGVAGYPEKHADAADFTTDIAHLKSKIEAGADYIITQMFFDNRHYFTFVDACRAAGISVPIIPGLKVLRSASQAARYADAFNITIPDTLATELAATPTHALEIGQRWATTQIHALHAAGVPHIHLFVMNDEDSVLEVLKA